MNVAVVRWWSQPYPSWDTQLVAATCSTSGISNLSIHGIIATISRFQKRLFFFLYCLLTLVCFASLLSRDMFVKMHNRDVFLELGSPLSPRPKSLHQQVNYTCFSFFTGKLEYPFLSAFICGLLRFAMLPGPVLSTMMTNIKVLLLNHCLPLKQTRGCPKMDFYWMRHEFWLVPVLRLLKKARVPSKVGGMFIYE